MSHEPSREEMILTVLRNHRNATREQVEITVDVFILKRRWGLRT